MRGRRGKPRGRAASSVRRVCLGTDSEFRVLSALQRHSPVKFMNQHAWQKTQKEPSGEGPGSCSRKAGKEGRGPGGCGCGAVGETSYSSGGSRPDLSLLFSCRISPVLIDHGKKIRLCGACFPSFLLQWILLQGNI